jgi:hypothetical protein
MHLCSNASALGTTDSTPPAFRGFSEHSAYRRYTQVRRNTKIHKNTIVASIRLLDGPARGIILLSVLRCSDPSTIMPLRCCIICKVEASWDLQLQYCAVCQSALYCSQACQREDWRKHKKICKLLIVGHGDMQVRSAAHTSISIDFSCDGDEDIKRFFKLFKESTYEGSQAAARKMRVIAKRQTKYNQKLLLFHSLSLLIRSDSRMLSWPNSPLLILLQFSILTSCPDTTTQHCKRARRGLLNSTIWPI